MRALRFLFAPIVGAATIYLAAHHIAPIIPTVIIGLAILAIGWRFMNRSNQGRSE